MAQQIRKQKAEAQAVPPGCDLLSDTQCAALLGVKPRTLRLWRRKRALPFIKITSREIRYRAADIAEWLSQRRVAMGGV